MNINQSNRGHVFASQGSKPLGSSSVHSVGSTHKFSAGGGVTTSSAFESNQRRLTTRSISSSVPPLTNKFMSRRISQETGTPATTPHYLSPPITNIIRPLNTAASGSYSGGSSGMSGPGVVGVTGVSNLAAGAPGASRHHRNSPRTSTLPPSNRSSPLNSARASHLAATKPMTIDATYATPSTATTTSVGGLRSRVQAAPVRSNATTTPGYSSAAAAHAASSQYSHTTQGYTTHTTQNNYTTQGYTTQNTYTTHPTHTTHPNTAERVTVNTYPGEERVIAEYHVEHDMKVPKRLIREEIIERTYVVPERVITEEIVEEDMRYWEKVVEMAKPIIQEKVVEVPEYEYVEKIVEVPQKVYQEKTREVPVYSVQERVVEVPKIVQQEKLVEIPVYEYRDVVKEKIVEVPEIREEVVIKEIPVPQYVEVPVPMEKIVEVTENIPRNVPVPAETISHLELVLPKIRPIRTAMDVPVYVPRFVEVPMPAEFCSEELVDTAERCGNEVARLMMSSTAEPLSLSGLEDAAAYIQAQNFEEVYSRQDFVANFVHWWRLNQLSIEEVSLKSICRSVEGTSGAVVTEAVSLVKAGASSNNLAAHVSQSGVNVINGLIESELGTVKTHAVASHDVANVVSHTATSYVTSDHGLEIAVLAADADAQSVKTDKAELDQYLPVQSLVVPALEQRVPAGTESSQMQIHHAHNHQEQLSEMYQYSTMSGGVMSHQSEMSGERLPLKAVRRLSHSTDSALPLNDDEDVVRLESSQHPFSACSDQQGHTSSHYSSTSSISGPIEVMPPETLEAQSPSPVFPIMKGMETNEVSAEVCHLSPLDEDTN